MNDLIPVVLDTQNSNAKSEPSVRILTNGDYYGNWQLDIPIGERPAEDVPILRCKVEIFPGTFLYGAACGRNLYLSTTEHGVGLWSNPPRHVEQVDPFFTVEAIGNSFHRTITVQEPYSYNPYRLSQNNNQISKVDCYGDTWDQHARKYVGGEPFNYLNVRVTFMGRSVDANFKFHQPISGEIDLDAHGPGNNLVRVTADFFGRKCEFDYDVTDSTTASYSRAPWTKFQEKYRICTVKQGKEAFLLHFLRRNALNDLRGIGGIEKRKDIRKTLDRLKSDEPLLFAFYESLKHGKTSKGMSNNRLLKEVLLECGHNYRRLKSQLSTVMTQALDTKLESYVTETRTLCMLFPSSQKAEQQRRAKTEWNFRVGIKAQAEGLGIDLKRHRELMKAVIQKKISLNLFHKTGDPRALINTQFDIWEKALRRKGWADVIYQICTATTNKNHFEKHVTPYLSFLFRIEKYLKHHTKRNWKAFPKVVDSEVQLEMQEKDENGTVKTRSALTPLPDNEKNTITVPYAGLKMYGAQTTYCYSKLYQVFEENTIDLVSETVIPHDLVKKLNGRDDYGLMYYTLDGSLEAQGYPTFLVIFERRGKTAKETFVHFHRVHPCRRKDGYNVPAHKLIEECYRYMAGNVRAEEIFAQQGDLIFIEAEKPANFDPDGGKAVLEFESHRFETQGSPAVRLFDNESKSIKNRLGFVYSPTNFLLAHPEHENVGFPAGYYEIRRCKSWEANPTAVWSYTFD